MIPPIANRFVAGETVSEALESAKERNQQGLPVILNLLGEHYDDPSDVASDRDTYIKLVRRIDAMDLDACISVKPSQLGLDIGEDNFRRRLEEILDEAAEHEVFVWIDMEDHETTDATIQAYEDFVDAQDGQLGVCLQANLKRTPDDLERLASYPGKIRLVKGAYKEPKDIAYRKSERVDEAYRGLIEQAFEQCDDGIAVASHDSDMLEHATTLGSETETPYEIQMLMGVRENLQQSLAEEHEVYQYVPYGNRWLSYFYRRMIERKENLLFGLRAIFGR